MFAGDREVCRERVTPAVITDAAVHSSPGDRVPQRRAADRVVTRRPPGDEAGVQRGSWVDGAPWWGTEGLPGWWDWRRWWNGCEASDWAAAGSIGARGRRRQVGCLVTRTMWTDMMDRYNDCCNTVGRVIDDCCATWTPWAGIMLCHTECWCCGLVWSGVKVGRH